MDARKVKKSPKTLIGKQNSRQYFRLYGMLYIMNSSYVYMLVIVDLSDSMCATVPDCLTHLPVIVAQCLHHCRILRYI